MKSFRPVLISCALLALVSAPAALAHGHLDVGPDASDGTRLALAGIDSETALYVPPGEPFSNYLPHFPGGYYASQLTVSAEDPAGSLARVELLAVSGPAGGSFGFWEINARTPTWSRDCGWASGEGDRPSLIVYEDGTGYGHIHGRAFTATRPGEYTVVFRAVDDAGLRAPSQPKSITFHVLATPPLTIAVTGGEARLSFISRADFTYDLQVSTDLANWATMAAHQYITGTGGTIEMSDPLADRPRVFYRLVEYF